VISDSQELLHQPQEPALFDFNAKPNSAALRIKAP
jgi:hypothetical protein